MSTTTTRSGVEMLSTLYNQSEFLCITSQIVRSKLFHQYGIHTCKSNKRSVSIPEKTEAHKQTNKVLRDLCFCFNSKCIVVNIPSLLWSIDMIAIWSEREREKIFEKEKAGQKFQMKMKKKRNQILWIVRKYLTISDFLLKWKWMYEREGELVKTKTSCTYTVTNYRNQLLYILLCCVVCVSARAQKYFYCDIENNTNKGVK